MPSDPPQLPQPWSETSPAERAAWIAEHVLGWEVPPDDAPSWTDEPWPIGFNPSVSPSDDYRVLEAMRKNENHYLLSTFDRWSRFYRPGFWSEMTYRALSGDDRP